MLDSSVVILVPLVIPVSPFVIPASFSCHSRASGNPDPTGSPIRSASLSVGDDKGCVIPAPPSLVIPVKTGIQSFYLDPASSAG